MDKMKKITVKRDNCVASLKEKHGLKIKQISLIYIKNTNYRKIAIFCGLLATRKDDGKLPAKTMKIIK